MIGNQVADVRISSMMIQSHVLPPEPPNWLINREIREYFNEEYVREYLMLSGSNQREIDDWMVPTLAYRVGDQTCRPN